MKEDNLWNRTAFKIHRFPSHIKYKDWLITSDKKVYEKQMKEFYKEMENKKDEELKKEYGPYWKIEKSRRIRKVYNK